MGNSQRMCAVWCGGVRDGGREWRRRYGAGPGGRRRCHDRRPGATARRIAHDAQIVGPPLRAGPGRPGKRTAPAPAGGGHSGAGGDVPAHRHRGPAGRGRAPRRPGQGTARPEHSPARVAQRRPLRGGGAPAVLARLHRAARHAVTPALPQPPPDAAPVLLACLLDEQHTLPLEALDAAPRERGATTRMPAAAVPAEALTTAVRRTGPPCRRTVVPDPLHGRSSPRPTPRRHALGRQGRPARPRRPGRRAGAGTPGAAGAAAAARTGRGPGDAVPDGHPHSSHEEIR